MKNSALQRAVILICVLIICLMAIYVMTLEKPHETNNDYLTVRESLIPMFGKAFSSEVYKDKEFPFNRINPKAREYIRFYIEEDNIDQVIGSVGVWLLGFIGDEEDILFVEQYIDKTILSSTNPDQRYILTDLSAFAGYFAGMMIKRDIKGAESFLKKYAKVSSWMVPGEEETPENLSDARDFYSYFIMCAYQYSKAAYIYPLLQEKSPDSKPYLHESFVDAYLAIKVDKYTELMKPVILPERELDENMAKCLERCREWIDRLLRKQTYVQWREAREKQKTVPKAEKKPVDSFESIDMSGTIEGAYLKAIASDAAKAYVQISRTLLDRNAKDLPIKKQILRDIQKAGLNNYDDFYIKAEVEAKINDFVPSVKSNEGKDEATAAEPVVVKQKETAEVTFNVLDSADILKKHASDADNIVVSSTTGDMRVTMERNNSTWFLSTVPDPNVSADSNMIEDDYLMGSANEAINAYKQIAQMLIDGNYDALTIPVLDNGKLIPLKKRKRQKDEMLEALDLEKRILEDLTKAKLSNYGDYRVKVKFEATLGNGGISLETSVMPLTVKGYETADVTFMIRDAAESYKKHVSKRMTQSDIDGAGNLRVYMKRINGKWYWNPFGW